MNLRFVFLLLFVFLTLRTSAAIQSTIIDHLDSQHTTAAEMALDIKEAFEKSSGIELEIYLAPEVALRTDQSSLGLGNLTLTRTLDLYTQIHPVAYEWKEDVVLIKMDESKRE